MAARPCRFKSCFPHSLMTLRDENTPGDTKKLTRLELILAETLAEMLRRGVFGTARIKLNVQDGTIQHIRHTIERIEQ